MNDKSSIIPSLEQNVRKTERVFSTLLGSYLLYSAVTGKKSLLKTIGAGFLLFRGSTGYCPVYGALKMDRTKTDGNITVKSFITTNKPRKEVYEFWRKLENLPFFMKHLKSVTRYDDKNSEWVANIPGGLGTIDWKAEIISELENEYIAWKSLPGSEVNNSGIVQFKDAGKFGTEVYIELSYHAPAGAIGEGIGRLLNPVLETMIKEDIKNFRKYIETGEVPTYKGQTTGKPSDLLTPINDQSL